jgi:plasmid maintenance system antidote protein VapI
MRPHEGGSHVTPEMVLWFSKALGRSPEICLSMQDAYDLWVAKKHVNLKRVGQLPLAAS